MPSCGVARNFSPCPAPQAKGRGVGWHLPGGRGTKSGLHLIPLLTGDALATLPKPSCRPASGWGRECACGHAPPPPPLPLDPGLPLFLSESRFIEIDTHSTGRMRSVSEGEIGPWAPS